MRIVLETNCSSATLKMARVELARQYDAMKLRYPDMQLSGKISGVEAERRLLAQGVALQAIADLEARVRQEEYASSQFGPQPGDE